MATSVATLTVFKIAADLRTKKSGGKLINDPDFESAMSNYMLLRILRMYDDTARLAAIVNRYQTLWSKEEMYKFLFNVVPQSRVAYREFLKAPKKTEKIKKDDGKPQKDEDGYYLL